MPDIRTGTKRLAVAAVCAAMLSGAGCVVYPVPPAGTVHVQPTPPPPRVHHDAPRQVVVLSVSDRAHIRTWYSTWLTGHEQRIRGIKPLPPGIRQRIRKGKPLPPGITRRAFPQELTRALSPLPRGYARVLVGTDVVLIETRTGIIHDVYTDAIPPSLLRGRRGPGRRDGRPDDGPVFRDAERGQGGAEYRFEDDGGRDDHHAGGHHASGRDHASAGDRGDRRGGHVDEVPHISDRDRAEIRRYFSRGEGLRRAREVQPLKRHQRAQVKRGRMLGGGYEKLRLPDALLRRLTSLPEGYRWVWVGADIVLVAAPGDRVIDLYADVVPVGQPAQEQRDHDEDRRHSSAPPPAPQQDGHHDTARGGSDRDGGSQGSASQGSARHHGTSQSDRQEQVARAMVPSFSDNDRSRIQGHLQGQQGRGKGKKRGRGRGPEVAIARQLEMGKPLPRGLAKQALPDSVEGDLSPLPDGYARYQVGTAVVLLNTLSNIVIDVVIGN